MGANSIIIIREAIKMVGTIGAAIIGAMITGAFIVFAAFISYKYGLKAYFKRREHEQIINRYLDEGIDRVIAAVHQALAVFVDNHNRAENILRQLQKKNKANLPEKFQWFERHSLELTPYHKVTYLTGDKIFWLTIQLLFGLVDGQSEYLNTDFMSTLKNIVLTKEPQDGKLKEVWSQIEVRYQKFEIFSALTTELFNIMRNLEKQKNLDWEKIDQFKNLTAINASVVRMKEKFEPELRKKLGER